ncbi:MAG: hypothetical protein U0Q18_01400 [Bryobacteraceae bacterium]
MKGVAVLDNLRVVMPPWQPHLSFANKGKELLMHNNIFRFGLAGWRIAIVTVLTAVAQGQSEDCPAPSSPLQQPSGKFLKYSDLYPSTVGMKSIVLSKPHLYIVFLTAGRSQPALESDEHTFLDALNTILGSDYLTRLSEYGITAPKEIVGYSQQKQVYAKKLPPRELFRWLIGSSSLNSPAGVVAWEDSSVPKYHDDPNLLYVLVDLRSKPFVQKYSFHGSVFAGKTPVPYAYLGKFDRQDDMTAALGHELVEAMSDPAPFFGITAPAIKDHGRTKPGSELVDFSESDPPEYIQNIAVQRYYSYCEGTSICPSCTATRGKP